ncbi:MAG: hypothetical protein QXF35_00775 [Candidatus Bilamarchaeaceae archaeon]
MVFGSFAEFAKKVMDAAKKGGLSARDLKRLERLLEKDGKRNKILAAGLVAAMKTGASEKEIEKLGKLFEKASERIANGKAPFTDADAQILRSMLEGAGISKKTSKWVSKNIDEMLAAEIKEFITGKKISRVVIPKKSEEEKKTLAVR